MKKIPVLLLVACGTAAGEVGDQIARYDFPDAGVSCWLYKADSQSSGSLSCVATSVVAGPRDCFRSAP